MSIIKIKGYVKMIKNILGAGLVSLAVFASSEGLDREVSAEEFTTRTNAWESMPVSDLQLEDNTKNNIFYEAVAWVGVGALFLGGGYLFDRVMDDYRNSL